MSLLLNEMAKNCVACHKCIPTDSVYLSCSECNYEYHLGSCSGVTESAYKKKSSEARTSWKCPTCRTANVRGGPSNAKEKMDREIDLANEIAEIHGKLNILLTIKEKVDALEGIIATVDTIEKSVQAMSDKYDEVIAQMKKQGADIDCLKTRVKKLEERVEEQKIDKLKQEMNDLDQYGRRLNLEIHGLPQQMNENVLEKLNILANDLKLPRLSESDVEAAHGLPKRAGQDEVDKPAFILVRFTSRLTRDIWLKQRQELRKSKSKIFFNENLTAQNKKLFWLMRCKARELHYQFFWVKNGKLFMRRSPRHQIVNIRTAEDLEGLR